MSGRVLRAVCSASRHAVTKTPALIRNSVCAAGRSSKKPRNAIAGSSKGILGEGRRYASTQAGPSNIPSAKKWAATGPADTWEDIEEPIPRARALRDTRRVEAGGPSSISYTNRGDRQAPSNDEWSGEDLQDSSPYAESTTNTESWDPMDTGSLDGEDAFVTSAAFSGPRNMKYAADEEVRLS